MSKHCNWKAGEGGCAHRLAERDRGVAVVPEQERPISRLEIQSHEDTGAFDHGVGTDE